MKNFEFMTVPRIVFGCGAFGKIGEIMGEYGDNYLVVVNNGFAQSKVMNALQSSAQDKGIKVTVYDGVSGEPEPSTVEDGLELALKNGCNGVIGMGGGTAIDTAKAIAGLITNGGPVTDYLEGVGIGRQVVCDTAPFIAVPLTAGTGAEVTKNAVISSMEHGYKKSFRSNKLLARVALVDPELTVGVSPKRTSWSGMDALTQLIESYVSRKSNAFTDSLAEKGIAIAAKVLINAYDNGKDIEAREGMCYASMVSGICLANSGLGAAHGFAAGLGAIKGVPHGLACAILLPHVMKINMELCEEKYAIVGKLLSGNPKLDDFQATKTAIEIIADMNAHMGIPADLKELSLTDEEITKIVSASFGSSMSGNPYIFDDISAFEFIKNLC